MSDSLWLMDLILDWVLMTESNQFCLLVPFCDRWMGLTFTEVFLNFANFKSFIITLSETHCLQAYITIIGEFQDCQWDLLKFFLLWI